MDARPGLTPGEVDLQTTGSTASPCARWLTFQVRKVGSLSRFRPGAASVTGRDAADYTMKGIILSDLPVRVALT